MARPDRAVWTVDKLSEPLGIGVNMKFGKQLEREAIPEWREYYISYKRLKRLMKKRIIQRSNSNINTLSPNVVAGGALLGESTPLLSSASSVSDMYQGSFEHAIQTELESVDTFFKATLAACRKDFIDTRNEVREGVQAAPELSPIPGFGRRRRFKEESPEKRLLRLYDKVQNLQEFGRLNKTGFRKIAKKYDKTTGDQILPELMQRMERETKFAGHCEEELLHLLKEINILYMQITNDPTHSAKEILADQKAAQGLFRVQVSWKWRPLLLGVAVFIALLLAPVFPPEHAVAQRCLVMLAFVSLLWVTEAVPFFVASLMVVVLSVLLKVFKDDSGHVMGADRAVDTALSHMFNNTVALIIGGFGISTAVSKYGFEQILAAALVGRLKCCPRLFVLAVMALCAFLSMWISNVAAPLLCLSIVEPIISDLPRRSRFTKTLLLGLAISGNIGGMLTPIASPQNAVTLGVFNSYARDEGRPDVQISFLTWILMALPNGIVLVVVGWLFLLVTVRPNDTKCLPDVVFESKKFNIFHYVVLGGLFTTIVLWCTLSFTDSLFGSMGFIALLPLVAFLSVGVLTKHDFRERFAWDLVFLIAGGNVLGFAIQSSNLLDILTQPISDMLGKANLPVWLLMVAAGAASILLCTVVSHTVGAIILTPLIVAIAAPMGLAAIRPVVVGAALMYSAAGALPMSSFPNINSLMAEDEREQKFLSPGDFLAYGGAFSLLTFAITISWGYLWMCLVL